MKYKQRLFGQHNSIQVKPFKLARPVVFDLVSNKLQWMQVSPVLHLGQETEVPPGCGSRIQAEVEALPSL